ncbi:MAG: hypothetical protein ACLPV8_18240 [Steroidobacteraceae bacterium]
MSSKTVQILLAALAVVALVATGGWYRASSALRDSRAHLVTSTLEPIALLLKENQALAKELQSEPFIEKNAGILGSYLAKIRRDGVPQHADMKQRLDQLAQNNTAIVTLIKAYTPQARTPAFSAEADKFLNYAIAWRDRWNSVMELFMAGGNYPAAGVPFPNGLPDAVQAEIAAAR